MVEPIFSRFEFKNPYSIGCLTWNDGIEISITIGSWHENRSKRQKMMLDQAILTDTVIKTKDQQLPCHKFVLAAESEYFKTMFQTNMTEKETNVVDWTDVFEGDVVKSLLHFFYTGHKPPGNMEMDHALKLLEAALLCFLPELKSICTEIIGSSIKVENAALVLNTVDILECNDLKKSVVKFIAANWKAVEATEYYQKLEPDVCKRLLASVFCVFSENFVGK